MASQNKRHNHRILEVLAVLLLGVATVGSAWCGYQASRWNGKQDDFARHASNLQVDANRQFGLATQSLTYDSNMLAQYAAAVTSGDEKLQQFLRTSLIRPAFLPILDQWQQQIAAGQTPSNLLENQDYLDAQLGPFRATQAEIDEAAVASQDAGSTGDDYVLTTLLLASALFFAGLTTSFRVRFAQLMLLAASALLIAYAAARLAELAVA